MRTELARRHDIDMLKWYKDERGVLQRQDTRRDIHQGLAGNYSPDRRVLR